MKTLLAILLGAAVLSMLLTRQPALTVAGLHPGMPAVEASQALHAREAAWDHLETTGSLWTASSKGCAASTFHLQVRIGPDRRVAAVDVSGAALPLHWEGQVLWTAADHLRALGPPSADIRGPHGLRVLEYEPLGLEVTFDRDDAPRAIGWR